MTKIGEFLRNYDIKANKYIKKGKVLFIDTNDGKYVLKQNKRDKSIYDYLNSRNFSYFPDIINNIEDEYEITKYVRQVEMPIEQKELDMISLVALLHLKTSYYKEIDNDLYKKIYEDLLNNIEYLYSYYIDIIGLIETKVFMSPSEYLLARNITKIFSTLRYLNEEIKEWYKLVEDKKKVRYAVLHNNLDVDHFIKNEDSYLVSWDKAKIDMPIFDLYKFYLKNNESNFYDIIKKYEEIYPLLDEEKKLLLILIKMPSLLEFNDNEYKNTVSIRKLLNNLDRSINIKLPNTTKDTE
ncbi:MAG TPA: hypothetical protein PLV83_03405 [Bacilli bacterium]|nr:hypothetical protein [Bacilli bacterium]